MKTPLINAALLVGMSLVTPAFGMVSIDYVYVGNAGNAPDDTGFGRVDTAYQISKYETTVSQYAEFLDAVAETDSHNLYNPSMGSDPNVAGITRSGTAGNYSYSVTGGGDRPIAYVSWFNAARFTNWVSNGQGLGSTETGTYLLNGATSGVYAAQVGATVWLPTQDQWYKAAYYDPTQAAYWAYPTQSYTAPGNIIGNDANQANGLAINGGDVTYAVTQSAAYDAAQNYLTPVGAFSGSGSAYGTFDQGGNVLEWNDAVVGTERGLRGGSWSDGDMGSSSLSYSNDPSAELGFVGFRLASIPEPTAGVLSLLAGSMLLVRRQRPATSSLPAR